jgi:hypothetical protein
MPEKHERDIIGDAALWLWVGAILVVVLASRYYVAESALMRVLDIPACGVVLLLGTLVLVCNHQR